MVRASFNTGWTVKPKVSGFQDLVGARTPGQAVTLPHDAMITLDRSPDAGEGPSTAFFPGGVIEYAKTFHAPQDWRRSRVTLEFDGVYRDAMVFVNGAFAGQRPNGYVPFRVQLDAHLRYGEENVIRVEARAHRDSRWYSGLGIHRGVDLVVTPLVHIAPDGVRITTPEVDDDLAVVEITTTVTNAGPTTQPVSLESAVRLEGKVVAAEASPLSVPPGESTELRQRLYLRSPRLWNVETPHLYELTSTLTPTEGGAVERHRVHTAFGVRSLRLDPVHGLRINGETVKLRGACIHHDNGVLGAAAFPRAEERRIEILKQAGFNAVRSSHNPISTTMLDACDRLGMLVLDEAFDVWYDAMKPFDYSLSFNEWWSRDIEAMVRRGFNHPSVIMYSIANEVTEAGSDAGAALARAMAAKIRELDETRFITNGVSSFWAVSAEILDDFIEDVAALDARGVNDVMNAMDEIFDRITTSDLVTERTQGTHDAVDVRGLNYGQHRYVADGKRFPHRVILGTETNPRATHEIWPLVMKLPHVIGDFTWTGWDYLGEVGLGRTDYTGDPEARGGMTDPAFPWLLAWCGDIDTTGYRRPASYYREIVWGRRKEPYLAVFRPEHHGQRRLEMQWAWSDAISSWTWDVAPGSPIEVEVYSDADEIELLLNGSPVGRAPVGSDHQMRAHFEIDYQPGTLVAVALADGVEVARTSLRTAAEPQLTVTPDRAVVGADGTDLCFLAIEFRDRNGILATASDRRVSVEVTGAGVLQGLGSARPRTTERYDASECTTFDGRALAVVRATGPGKVRVRVEADGLEPVVTEIDAR